MTARSGEASLPWLAAGIDLLFPPCCRLCGREAEPGRRADRTDWPDGVIRSSRFCAPCTVTLATGPVRCGRCAAPGESDGCHSCRGRGADHDGIVVLGGYEGLLREAVLRAKRPAGRDIAEGLAELLHARHADALAAWRIDTVVPVPMHWRRRFLRGSSAADVLAAAIARAARAPCVRVLRRRRATVMQNRLPRGARRDAVRGAFAARPGTLEGRRVLLVDDVLTTGGTVAACRQTLVAAGAAAVFAAVVAKADLGDDDPDGSVE